MSGDQQEEAPKTDKPADADAAPAPAADPKPAEQAESGQG